MPRRRAFIAGAGAALGLALGSALGGCSRRDAGAPLRIWAMGREGEVLDALLAPLLREQPALRLRVEKLPWSAAHEKLLTAFAGDATPDIAQLGNTWIAELAALGALQPLDAAAAGLDPADHFEGIWRTNLVGGQLLGLPWYIDTRVMFYRRDLFERAGVPGMPGDWPGLVQALDALQRSGVAHPLLLPLNEAEPLLALALQQDEPLLRDGGRFGNFRSAGFQRTLAFYVERFERGHAPFLTSNQVANLWQEFGRGSFAAFISGPWNIGELDRRLPADLQSRWSTAPLPGPVPGPAGSRFGASTAGGSSLVVFKRSRHQQQALQVLAFLGRPQTQLHFHALTGNLPPRRSTWALAPLAGERRAAAFLQQLELAKPTPAVPEWERILQEMQLQAARAQRYGTPVAEAAAALDARVDGFLTKRRWMLAHGGAAA